MPVDVLDRIRRISGRLGRLKAIAGDRTANLTAAVALTLTALLWLAASTLYADPSWLVVLPVAAVALTALAAASLVLGGIGFLVAQLIRAVLLWRAHEELREGADGFKMIWVIAVVIFLGVPEFAHAITWWHEHALRFLPGEEEALDQISSFYDRNQETILGLAIIGAMGCSTFWGLFRNFRVWLRQRGEVTRKLFADRNWKIPAALAIATVLTIIFLLAYPRDPLGELLSVEIIALIGWVFLPIVLPNLGWILLGAACAVPAIVVNNRLDGPEAAWLGALILWSAWLFSIEARWMWRGVYWLGVIGCLAYLVR
jgi:hypothetical protein